MDHLILSRIQFATNITFHILFPAITIGLCWCLLFFKIKYNQTKNEDWFNLYRFWVKIFALCFALGVVSGITMSFQFGTNWPLFMQKVGNIAGPLLAYEVLTAFFMEATFLGIMLFGINKVSNKIHTLATFLVAIGTTISAFWIIVLDSWMQTPAGFVIKDNIIYAGNWFEIIFNPSMIYRFCHMLLASFLTSAFLIMGISAYKIIKHDNSSAVNLAMKFAIYLAFFIIPLQIFVGDLHGINTLQHQPAKVAAIEGIWHTEKPADLRLFAIVDNQNQKNSFEIKIPKLASIILTHKADSEIKGINEFTNHPPVAQVFYSFRIMVGTGLLMLVVASFALYFLLKHKTQPKIMLFIMIYMTFSGWVATIAGWYVTEIGRQPFLVYNLLTTADAVSPNLQTKFVLSSLILYSLVYVVLIFAFIKVIFYMARQDIKNVNTIKTQ
ncbi:MAG: cytochrome ubiquinol oxidase subunit I [Proteobacteria bacterium]|jgi:cytochrome d ubiquinol oxidase subunit I|nr:cytochrome ubiquinol oxidase subunit I [Pseudomonadota bacterium]